MPRITVSEIAATRACTAQLRKTHRPFSTVVRPDAGRPLSAAVGSGGGGRTSAPKRNFRKSDEAIHRGDFGPGDPEAPNYTRRRVAAPDCELGHLVIWLSGHLIVRLTNQ